MVLVLASQAASADTLKPADRAAAAITAQIAFAIPKVDGTWQVVAQYSRVHW
ncbi:MAG: hypothetical protein H0T79_20540 [Deltaproteobacteria bacterium]|nr:hypothetical protein [Deltaproteobacteria bacterium]